LPRSWVGYPSRRPKGCGMQSPSGPKVYPWNGPHAGRKGAVAGLACARAARAGRAGRMACAWPRGASLGGGRAGIGRWRWIWIAIACPRSVGGGRGAGQAAERVARAGARQLGGWCVAAGCGPALGWPACACRAGSWWVCVQDAGGRRASTSARRIRRVTAVRPVSLV